MYFFSSFHDILFQLSPECQNQLQHSYSVSFILKWWQTSVSSSLIRFEFLNTDNILRDCVYVKECDELEVGFLNLFSFLLIKFHHLLKWKFSFKQFWKKEKCIYIIKNIRIVFKYRRTEWFTRCTIFFNCCVGKSSNSISKVNGLSDTGSSDGS